MVRYRKQWSWGIAGVVILAVIGGTFGWWKSRASGLVAQARNAYEKKQWVQAATLAQRQLQQVENDPEALRILARASYRLNRDGTATAIYKDKLGTAQMQPEDHFLLGLALVRRGQDQTALKIWNKAVSEGPEHPEMLASLAQEALALGQLDIADSAAHRLAQQPGWEPRGLLFLGEAQHLLDDPRAAADALDRGLRFDPGARGLPLPASYYRLLLARSWLQLGRPSDAREQLAAVSAAAGQAESSVDREAQWLLSRAWLQERRFSEASAALARAGGYRGEHRLMPEPSPYLGSAACASCHSEIATAYDRTRHARSFHHGAELLKLPLPDRPMAAPDDSRVTLSFSRDKQRIRVETREADRLVTTMVDFAFGTRERYVTMIGRDDDGNYRGVRLSYYHTASGSGWDRTAGDAGAPPGNDTMRGREIEVRGGVVRCLQCHVTRPGLFREPPPEAVGPEIADTAVGCERCHGPGGNHATAIEADFPDRAISLVRAGSAPASVVNEQCAGCHTVDIRAAIQGAPDDPHYVRSPGMTLTFSRCYTQSEGGLSCLTCHDPHTGVESSATYYETRCLKCHDQGQTKENSHQDRQVVSTLASTARLTTCPVNPRKDCLKCHMPKIPVADLHTTLTDHYIRIHKELTTETGGSKDPALAVKKPNSR